MHASSSTDWYTTGGGLEFINEPPPRGGQKRLRLVEYVFSHFSAV